MNAREYTAAEARRELERRSCPKGPYKTFYTRITRAGIGHRRDGRWYFTEDDIDALTERIGVRRADEYSFDATIAEIRARIGRVVTRSALYRLRREYHIGHRVGGTVCFAEQDIAAICAHYTHSDRFDRMVSRNAAPRTRGPAPNARYTTPELRTEIHRLTGRHVRSTWLGHSFAPSGGLHWTGGDLLHICAYLDDHPGWRRPQIAADAAPVGGG